jgi:capsid protein
MSKVGFRRFQTDMIEQFYDPIYEWKLRQWALVDPIIAPLAAGIDPRLLLRHEFIPPSWEYLDPLKDAQADTQIIDRGLNTRRARLGANGLNIEEVDRDIIEDNTRLLVAALTAAGTINTQFDDADITWRDVLNPWQRDTAPIGGPEPEPPTIPGDSQDGDST